jgi:SAM-dependent methyltransferase
MARKYVAQITEAYELLADESEERAAGKLPFIKGLVAGFAPHITTGREVYDLGCGVGLAARAFLDLGFSVTGIDVSAKSLAYARRRNPEATFIQQDFLDFETDKKIDAAFANAFIHLFTRKDAKLVMRKIHSTLKDGGVLFLSTDLCSESREGVLLKPYYVNKVKRFKRYWARKELEDLVVDSGFDLDRSFTVPDYYREFEWLILYGSKTKCANGQVTYPRQDPNRSPK